MIFGHGFHEISDFWRFFGTIGSLVFDGIQFGGISIFFRGASKPRKGDGFQGIIDFWCFFGTRGLQAFDGVQFMEFRFFLNQEKEAEIGEQEVS